MNIILNTTDKIITIIEIVDIKAFVKFLKKLPDWKKYKIIPFELKPSK